MPKEILEQISEWSNIEEELLQGLMKRKQQECADMSLPVASLLECYLKIMGMHGEAAQVHEIRKKLLAYRPAGWVR